VTCVCNATRKCQYHARGPRRCPACKTGQLDRSISRREGIKKPIGRRPAWFCNRCEFCEEAK